MESTTYIKNVKMTPKKMRMLIDNIKKLSPVEALDYLLYSPQKQSRLYYKAIKSAIHNAEQSLKVSSDMLQFKLLTIEEGQKLKRYRAGSRGMAKQFRRRYSHIKIVLEPREAEGKKSSKKSSTTETNAKNEPKKKVDSKRTKKNNETETQTKKKVTKSKKEVTKPKK